MFENPRRGRQARNFTTNVPKILVLKSSSEQIFSRKLPLGAPAHLLFFIINVHNNITFFKSMVLCPYLREAEHFSLMKVNSS